jgi:hypothetical protein
MRILIACLCMLVGSLPSVANAYGYCSEPSEPTIPSGAYADEYAMERARREVEDFLEEIAEYKECLMHAAQEADDAAEEAIDEWNRAVRNYNNQ